MTGHLIGLGVLLQAVGCENLLHDQEIELVVVSDKEGPSGYGPHLGYDLPYVRDPWELSKLAPIFRFGTSDKGSDKASHPTCSGRRNCWGET